MRLLENILEAGQQFLNGIHISRPEECQLKMTNIQGDQAPAKWQKMLKTYENIHEDHRRTVHELADTIGIGYGVCQEILTENLNMHHVATKFVPQLLANDQKRWCVNVCLELREKANKDPSFISRFMTGGESWIYCYDPEAEQQLSQWKSPQSPRVKKALQVWCSTKSMPIIY
jgi:hypothetical protein